MELTINQADFKLRGVMGENLVSFFLNTGGDFSLGGQLCFPVTCAHETVRQEAEALVWFSKRYVDEGI